MRRDAKIRASIWLSGALLAVAALAYVVNPLAGSAIESPHAYYLNSSTGDDSNSGLSPSSA